MRGTSQVELLLRMDYTIDPNEMTIFELDDMLDAIKEMKEKREQIAAQQQAMAQSKR